MQVTKAATLCPQRAPSLVTRQRGSGPHVQPNNPEMCAFCRAKRTKINKSECGESTSARRGPEETSPSYALNGIPAPAARLPLLLYHTTTTTKFAVNLLSPEKTQNLGSLDFRLTACFGSLTKSPQSHHHRTLPL